MWASGSLTVAGVDARDLLGRLVTGDPTIVLHGVRLRSATIRGGDTEVLEVTVEAAGLTVRSPGPGG
jgi:hypothetical protein